MIQNGIRMLDDKGMLVKTAIDDGEEPDDEDTGEKGYNYLFLKYYMCNVILEDGFLALIVAIR